MMLRRTVVPAICLLLAACTSVSDTFNATAVDVGEAASVKRIYVATSRRPSGDPRTLYSSQRSQRLNFDALDIGIPKDHRPGHVEAASIGQDPARHFTLAGRRSIADAAAFRSEINAELASRAEQERELFIYVHGFNNNFVSSTFRHAQMVNDFGSPGVAVHYAWPSAGKSDGYVYDRDSAIFAQRGLAELLSMAAATDATKITLLAHSMGSLVTTQALRLLAAGRDTRTIQRLNAVVLAAPDVDVDVFDAMLDELGDVRPGAMVVFVSERDAALRLSSRIRGGSARVGEGRNLDDLIARGIIVLDVSDVDGGRHGTIGNSPTLISMVKSGRLRNTLQSARRAQAGSATVSDTSNAGQLIIRLPQATADALRLPRAN